MVDGENLFPVFASTNPRERRNGVPQGARRVAYARANLALMRFFRGDDCYPGLGRLLPGSETFRYPGVGDDYYPGQRGRLLPGSPIPSLALARQKNSRWHVKKRVCGSRSASHSRYGGTASTASDGPQLALHPAQGLAHFDDLVVRRRKSRSRAAT